MTATLQLTSKKWFGPIFTDFKIDVDFTFAVDVTQHENPLTGGARSATPTGRARYTISTGRARSTTPTGGARSTTPTGGARSTTPTGGSGVMNDATTKKSGVMTEYAEYALVATIFEGLCEIPMAYKVEPSNPLLLQKQHLPLLDCFPIFKFFGSFQQIHAEMM